MSYRSNGRPTRRQALARVRKQMRDARRLDMAWATCTDGNGTTHPLTPREAADLRAAGVEVNR